MNQNNLAEIPSDLFLDTVAQGDCVELMRLMPAASVDFILTDPPYLVDYRSRDGRAIQNDTDDRWLKPAFAEAHRVLRSNRFCVCFYGWSKADKFIAAWRAAGFRPVGHLVFRKGYASATRFLRYPA
jgi:DNA modification methylase